MERIVLLVFVLVITISGRATSEKIIASVDVDKGRVGIGAITGGHFGPGSFSIGADGVSLPTQFQATKKGKPTTEQSSQSGPNNSGGKGGTGGHIFINTVIIDDEENKKNGNNQRPASNDALEAMFVSNNGHNGQGIQIGLITGGTYEQEETGIKSKEPYPDHNNKGTGHPNAANEVYHSIEHNAHSNGNVNNQANSGYGSETDTEKPWVWGSSES